MLLGRAPIEMSASSSAARAATYARGDSARSAGELRLAQNEDAISHTTASGLSPGSSSYVSNEFWKKNTDAIVWDVIRLGHRIQPYCAYAHCADDVYLLSSFLELAQVPDVDGESVKLLLRVLKFLRLCDYSVEDICSILAHASSYFVDAFTLCGDRMDACEVGNVLATLIFVAHCYVQDETCPLHVWHKHLFRRYCPLKTLNSAIMRLMEIRRYVLRLDSGDLNRRFECLLQAVLKRRETDLPDRSGVQTMVSTPDANRAKDNQEEGHSTSVLSGLWWLEHFKYR